MNIVVYEIFDNPKSINRNLTGTQTFIYNVRPTEPVDLLFPTFIIDPRSSGIGLNQPKFNYCFVQDWDRYYFIKDSVALTGRRGIIRCEIDVLYTYSEAIKRLNATCIRNGGIGKPTDVIDSSFPLYTSLDYNTSLIVDTIDKGASRDYYVLTTK